MSRPWTAIATEKASGKRTTIIFEGSFDGSVAIKDFGSKHKDFFLEALVPGVHPYTLVQDTSAKNTKSIPLNQLFSGF